MTGRAAEWRLAATILHVLWIDIMTAVGTAAAVIVALAFGVRAEWRVGRLERSQREAFGPPPGISRRIMDDRQAGTHGDGPEVDADDPSIDWRVASVQAVVHNGSDEPVWDVVVMVPGLVTKPGTAGELELTTFNEEYTVVGPRGTVTSAIDVLTTPYKRLPLEVEFRDNAGTEWRRDFRGRLHRGRTTGTTWSTFDRLV